MLFASPSFYLTSKKNIAGGLSLVNELAPKNQKHPWAGCSLSSPFCSTILLSLRDGHCSANLVVVFFWKKDPCKEWAVSLEYLVCQGSSDHRLADCPDSHYFDATLNFQPGIDSLGIESGEVPFRMTESSLCIVISLPRVTARDRSEPFLWRRSLMWQCNLGGLSFVKGTLAKKNKVFCLFCPRFGFPKNQTPIWVWLKINQEGLRRFCSIFPLTRVRFWYRFFEPQLFGP